MPARHLLATAVLAQSTTVYTLTAGRLWSVVGVAIGVAGAVVGGLALARPTGRIGSRGAVAAVAAGTAGAVVGVVVVAAADGGPGTGYGIVGGYVALVVGLVAVVIGALAMARSRRTV